MPTRPQHPQKGNALFLVLVAVALFAALSYAITMSGRGGSGGTTKETATLNVAQITDYGAAIRTAVTRMTLTGVVINTVDFKNGDTGTTAVFDSGGGGVAWITAPPATTQDTVAIDGIHAGPNWRFKAIPTDGTKGFYIIGIGNAGPSPTGADAFAFVGMTKAACTTINTGLNINVMPTESAPSALFSTTVEANEGLPSDAGGYKQENPGGAFGAYDLGKYFWSGNGNGIPPQAFACVSNDAAGAGPYIYYHTVIEQ